MVAVNLLRHVIPTAHKCLAVRGGRESRLIRIKKSAHDLSWNVSDSFVTRKYTVNTRKYTTQPARIRSDLRALKSINQELEESVFRLRFRMGCLRSLLLIGPFPN